MGSVGKELELHDRIIVATAFIHKAILVSKDPEISVTKEIKTIW